VKPYAKDPDTIAQRRLSFLRGYALSFLDERFDKLAKKPGTPLDGASYGYWNQSDLIEGWALHVSCHPSKWKEALALARDELNRTLAEGFTEDERKEGLRRLINYGTQAPQPEKYSPGTYLEWMLHMVRGGDVALDDRKEIELMKVVKDDFTLEKINGLLNDTWKDGELYLYSFGNLDLGKDAGQALEQAWKSAATPAADVKGADPKSPDQTPPPGEAPALANWAYAAKGAEGKIAKQDAIADLKITQIRFENGVQAVLRQSDQFKGSVLMLVRVGEGMLALEPDMASMGWVSSRVFLRGGLGKHPWDDVEKLTEGTGFGFGVDVDACVFQGGADWERCTRLFEVICAYLMDPGFRAEPYDEFMAELPRMYENLDKGTAGPLNLFNRKLYSDDLRFGIPDRNMVESYLLDDIKSFLVPQLESGPLQIALIGGISVDTMKKALARTFGLLPPRHERTPHPERLKVAPLKSGIKINKPIETETKVATLRIVFPTTDGIDAKTRRKLYFLSEVIDEGLRVEVRENKGAAYSPSSQSHVSRIFPGLGWIQIDVECDPSKVDEVTNTCFKVTEALVKKGVKEEDVKRIRTIATTNHQKQLESDGFWFSGMFDSLSNPAAFDDLRNAKSWYDDIGAAEITELAKKYLPRAKSSSCIIVPKKAAKKS
jgi:zinc protease